MLREGRRAGEIAAVLGVHIGTGPNWRGYFAPGGGAGLRRRPRPGRQSGVGRHAGAIAAAILTADVPHDRRLIATLHVNDNKAESISA